MRISYKVACLAAASSAVLALGGGAAADPGYAGQPASDARAERDARAGEAAAAMRNERPGDFAGIRVQPDGRLLVLDRRADDEAFQQRTQQRLQTTEVDFHVVARPLRDLEALRDRIRADLPTLEGEGIEVVSYGPRTQQNTVGVVVTNPTESTVARLRERYGNDVLVEAGRRPQTEASRLNDVAPWNGGDLISSDGANDDCTSGPAVKASSGKVYLLTAGHCYVGNGSAWTGNYIFRAFNGSDLLTGDNPRLMGNAAAENANGYDVALIDTSASGFDWRTAGTNDQGTAVAQKQQARALAGTTYCVSGAFSGERCNALVGEVDQDVALANGNTLRHMAIARSGTVISGPGDSGAPVYSVQSTGVFVVGIHLAGDGGNVCPQNNVGTRANRCSTTEYFQDIGSTLNHRGLASVYLR